MNNALSLLEEAARIAENGCLVPPDGGSPTEAERDMCKSIASAIRALQSKAAKLDIDQIALDAVHKIDGLTWQHPLQRKARFQVVIADAIRASLVAKSWQCMGRKQALPEPAECNWPDCGCDPHATKASREKLMTKDTDESACLTDAIEQISALLADDDGENGNGYQAFVRIRKIWPEIARRAAARVAPEGAVAWQYRVMYDITHARRNEWCGWHTCTKSWFDKTNEDIASGHKRMQTRALYAHPLPVMATREEIAKIVLETQRCGFVSIAATGNYRTIFCDDEGLDDYSRHAECDCRRTVEAILVAFITNPPIGGT